MSAPWSRRLTPCRWSTWRARTKRGPGCRTKRRFATRRPRRAACSLCQKLWNEARYVSEAKDTMYLPNHLFCRKAACRMTGLALAVAALNTGCISTEQTVYQDQERVRIEFENDTAGRLFYEALSKQQS